MAKLNNPYTFFNTLGIRIPMLPLTQYERWIKGVSSKKDYQLIWKQAVVKEAIYLSSPVVYKELEQWLVLGNQISDEKARRLEHTFIKYLSRMSSRCTPFGLFAGCILGTFDQEEEEVVPVSYEKYKRSTRLDMNVLVALGQELAKDVVIRKQLKWYPNNSIYRIGDQYRYMEYTYDENYRRRYSLEAVMQRTYLDKILNKAEEGASIITLASEITDRDITIEEATAFVEELIHYQILVSELEPTVTGADFMSQLQKTLQLVPGTTLWKEKINKWKEKLAILDRKLGNSIEDYLQLTKEIRELIPLHKEVSYLFQTDLFPVLEKNKVSKRIGYVLQRMIPVFYAITAKTKKTALERFKDSFVERYETKEVPLTIALDTETGIGYGSVAVDDTPFLDGISVPGVKQETVYQWTDQEEWWLRELEKANGSYSMSIDELPIEREVDWQQLPDTLSAMVQLITVEGKQRLVCKGVSGGATRLFGRFSSTDEEMQAFATTISAQEQMMEEECILAEIVHLPEARTGNIIQRAQLRSYEIPYLGRASVSPPYQLPISDLWVSVRQGKLVLYSKKNKKQVIPCLSNAHNYGNLHALPIYHFLCDMQGQQKQNYLGFQWGEIAEKRSFLPRVTYKNVIVSRARWRIVIADLKKILEATNEKDWVEEITRWRIAKQMPDRVQLVEGDNVLLIHLEVLESLQMFWAMVKKRKYIIIREFLSDVAMPLVAREKDSYAHELIVSFYKSSDKSKNECH
ncbi:lantibiotic dehydratase family protein [Aquimarina hainanensis]|uniref:Lantibiotic dehydratase family protein n=1 Tax=Aquimarina hainanensis TaxID=1578017 RepID=A0ABW5N1N2_9FLAO